MKRNSHPWLPLILGLLFFGIGLPARAQNTNLPPKLDYSAFKIIADRNIFNPKRRARIAGQDRRETRTSRVDYFALVGIMSYAKGPFAFFDGTSSDYRKVLKIGDSIAGYKVTNIEPNSAKLASSTNQVELRVGMQLRREDSGGWHLAAAGETGATTNSATKPAGRSGRSSTAAASASASTGGTNTDSAIAAAGAEPQVVLADPPSETAGTNADPATASDSTETDPVLRRLMERRNQEINR